MQTWSNPSAGFTLAGTGTYEPVCAVTSDQLDASHRRALGTTLKLGIRERRYATADETSSYMAAEAGRRAVADAGWELETIDALIGACGVMEQPIPGTAPLVQRRLGLGEIRNSRFRRQRHLPVLPSGPGSCGCGDGPERMAPGADRRGRHRVRGSRP